MNRDQWLDNLVRPLMIGVMFGCIALSLAGLIRLFLPSWSEARMVVGCVLAALEANYSYRLVKARSLRGAQALRFRAIEVATFFILLKIGGYVGHRWADVWADIQTWGRHPLNVVDSETTVAFILALLSWWVATQTVRDLERIGEPPELRRYYTPPRESLTSRFFWGGIALLIFAGLGRIGIAQLLNMRRPSVPGLVLNVLIYFLLGLVMLGQVQFATLRYQWQVQRSKIADELGTRWVRYSLIFIGLTALVAFLLPTGYTMGLLDSAGGMLSLIVGILWFVVGLLYFLITLPLWLLLSLWALLLGEPPLSPWRLRRIQSLRPELRSSVGLPLGWLEILRSFIFWIAALGMVYYVIRSYLHDHPEMLQALARLKPIRALRGFLIALWRRLVGLVEIVNERFPRRLSSRQAGAGSSGEPFRFFRLGALSPRERVLYYYLSILRRAERQGFPRRRAQTPYEYDIALGSHLPEVQYEMNLLTRAFVKARYSLHPIDRGQERLVRAVWERVRPALQALKREGEDAG